jgi:tRNA dimethylallyltransferase
MVFLFLWRKANKSCMHHQISPENKFIIVVAGPTAVGKTDLVIHLANVFGAEVFSADSRQIYREMSVGTAKPLHHVLSKVKHHFIDEASIFEKYSVGQFEKDMDKRLTTYFKSKNIAILTGGTGLYLKAVMEGLDEFPDVPEEITARINDQYHRLGLSFIQHALMQSDPKYYALVDTSNHRRIIRALSIIEASGRAYSSFLSDKSRVKNEYQFINLVLERPRAELYQRINSRVDQMLSNGLVDEALLLHKYRGLSSLETVGYQELFDFFEGKFSFEDAVELIKQNSRRYAKRQLTWLRKYAPWPSFHPDDHAQMVRYIEQKIV